LAWSIEFDPGAFEELEKLDRDIQRRILRYLRERSQTAENPHQFGKPLRGKKAVFWRHRVGAHRLVCLIEQEELKIRVMREGHRKDVYEER
jgi:mRNA interferase RelE/StbE